MKAPQRITLGAIKSQHDIEIALNEITRKMNQIIEFFNADDAGPPPTIPNIQDQLNTLSDRITALGG